MFLKIILCLLISICSLHATSHYPVDISFLVADLKFSQEHGVKICEVQQGLLSTFKGDIYSHQGEGLICPNLAHQLATFPINKWIACNHLYPPLMKSLQTQGWKKITFFEDLLLDSDLSELAKRSPSNSHFIDSYGGIFLSSPIPSPLYDHFHKKYPNIIFFDAAINPYVGDKYKMSQLFRLHPDLAKIKPEWGHYPKIYSPALVQTILEEIPSNLYVIKPRGAALGKGVIVVPKEELDDTLKTILNKTFENAFYKNEPYTYWINDKSDIFIVEKYYPSDPIQVSHLDNQWYNPTMRVAFLCIYNKEKIDCSFLGSYWRLPSQTIDATDDLNARTKDAVAAPYFMSVSDEIERAVIEQLTSSLTILYEKMLERNYVDEF